MPHPRRLTAALVLALLAGVSLLVYLTGPPHLCTKVWDTMGLLDAARRVHLGQRPHNDFHSPIGPVLPLLFQLGITTAGMTAALIAHTLAPLPLLLGGWMWCVARSRLPLVPAAVLAMLTGVVAAAPRPLGDAWRETGYAMLYNRLGWSMLAIVMTTLLIRPREPISARRGTAEYVIAGAIAAALLFTKINFGVIAVATVGLAAISLLLHRRELQAVLTAYLVVTLVLLGYLRFQIEPWVWDIKQVSAAYSNWMFTRALETPRDNWLELTALFTAVALAAPPLLRTAGHAGASAQLRAARPLIICLFIMGAAAATSLACQQRGDIPLLALVAFALIEPVRSSGRSSPRVIAVITAAGVLCASIILVTDLVTIGYAFAWHVIKAPKADETTRIAAAPLHGLIFPRAETPNATARDVRLSINQHDPKLVFPFYTSWQYAMLVNDGLAVLRGRTSADTAVLCLDFTDPFTFALNLRPVRGGEIFWFSTTPRHFPNTAELLSKADLVMAPKRPVYVPAGEAVIARFTPPLRRDFRLLAESDYWQLYKRRATASN